MSVMGIVVLILIFIILLGVTLSRRLDEITTQLDDIKNRLGLKPASDIKDEWVRYEEDEAVGFAKMLNEGKTLEEVERLIEESYQSSFKSFMSPNSKSKLLAFVKEVAARKKS